MDDQREHYQGQGRKDPPPSCHGTRGEVPFAGSFFPSLGLEEKCRFQVPPPDLGRSPIFKFPPGDLGRSPVFKFFPPRGLWEKSRFQVPPHGT